MHDPAGGEAPSTEAYLFSYLRMLETHGEGLPPAFVEALGRTLAHYGVTTLDRSPELEESLLWIYKSHQRVEQQVAPILALLERRLARVDGLSSPYADESFRTLLDRMIAITRGLFPAVSDLARELRYRCFEQPLFEQARKQIYAASRRSPRLSCRQSGGRGPARESKRADRMSAAAGELLLRPVCRRRSQLAAIDVGSDDLSILSRAITRQTFARMPVNGHCCVSAEYVQDGRRVHVFAAHADYRRLREARRRDVPLPRGSAGRP